MAARRSRPYQVFGRQAMHAAGVGCKMSNERIAVCGNRSAARPESGQIEVPHRTLSPAVNAGSLLPAQMTYGLEALVGHTSITALVALGSTACLTILIRRKGKYGDIEIPDIAGRFRICKCLSYFQDRLFALSSVYVAKPKLPNPGSILHVVN
jgi:hypothetical protein